MLKKANRTYYLLNGTPCIVFLFLILLLLAIHLLYNFWSLYTAVTKYGKMIIVAPLQKIRRHNQPQIFQKSAVETPTIIYWVNNQ